MFVVGGVSGVVTAAVPADLQLTDTYFVVAHLHYVLIGINLFGVLGGLYFWFPKMTGRMLGERLGRWNFWITFIGFNVAFLPMHLTGLMGMPRRIYTYPADLGLETVNMICTLGSFLLGVGILLFVINVCLSCASRARARQSVGRANTRMGRYHRRRPPTILLIPAVASRHPLWEDRMENRSGRTMLDRGLALDHGKEALATTVLDAEPDVILKMPDDSPWPFIADRRDERCFTALLLQSWWIGRLSVAGLLPLRWVWLWPERKLAQRAAPPNV